jgi:hypothetical protein
MLEIKTTTTNMRIFLSLTGHAFDEHSTDKGRTRGFYWAMRWLARQVIGQTWMRWLSEPL